VREILFTEKFNYCSERRCDDRGPIPGRREIRIAPTKQGGNAFDGPSGMSFLPASRFYSFELRSPVQHPVERIKRTEAGSFAKVVFAF
jgi:hypothetical protein